MFQVRSFARNDVCIMVYCWSKNIYIYIYQKILQKFLVFSLLILRARMKCQILHFQCINYVCRLIFIKITWLSRQKIIAASKLINDWGAVWIASFLNIWDETTVNSKFTTNFEVSIAPTKINNWKCTRFREPWCCVLHEVVSEIHFV